MVCGSNTGYAKQRETGKKVAAFDNLVMHVPTAWVCEIFKMHVPTGLAKNLGAGADRVCETKRASN